MYAASKTDIGRMRSTNQDVCSCGAFEDGSAWTVVCDGMGGVNGGNIASSIASETIVQCLQDAYAPGMDADAMRDMMLSAVQSANDAVIRRAEAEPDLYGMGTTAVVAIAAGGGLHIAHAGDSRAYLAPGSKLTRVTTDHSIVQELVNHGDITEEEARVHPQKNIITRVLGVEPTVEIDYQEFEILPGDCLLLCTDGLTNYVEDRELLKASAMSPKDCCSVLVSMAKDSGGGDNITVVAVKN